MRSKEADLKHDVSAPTSAFHVATCHRLSSLHATIDAFSLKANI